MSVTPRPGLAALAAAGSLLLIVTAPASAFAKGHDDGPGHDAKDKHVKVAHFTAHGLVVASDATSAQVMARTLTGPHGVRHNKLITITLGTGEHHSKGKKPAAAPLTVGNRVEVTGTETGTGDSEVFTSTHIEQHAEAAHVYLGMVIAVNGTTIKVTKGGKPSDDPSESDNGFHGLLVDVSKATVTVDGAAGTLAVGQTVAVLGEGDECVVTAAAVYAFTVAPSVVSGKVTAIAGSKVTLGHEEEAVTVDRPPPPPPPPPPPVALEDRGLGQAGQALRVRCGRGSRRRPRPPAGRRCPRPAASAARRSARPAGRRRGAAGAAPWPAAGSRAG